MRCQTYTAACEAEINEVLSSLTTPPPVEYPTIVTIECLTQPPTMETTSIQCQCPTPPTMEIMPVQCQCSIGPLMNDTSITKHTNCLSSLLGLGVFIGLTTVALVTVIIGWIITCVYYQQKMKTQ